tara:strand:- start:372 stop:575 length:204 start_codon:yes stop_codon:yes gene_type:complete
VAVEDREALVDKEVLVELVVQAVMEVMIMYMLLLIVLKNGVQMMVLHTVQILIINVEAKEVMVGGKI